MQENGTIQWFPGHMAKTRRLLKEALSQVDAVAEILDARIPCASRNPDIDQLADGKPRILILNKTDIADEAETRRWTAHFRKQGYDVLSVDCKSGKGVSQFLPTVREILAEKLAQKQAKGIKNPTVNVMVVGIPNVGKSSFINRLVKTGGKAKAEDRPGVTRQNRWFSIGDGVSLLDTPGVLWPKFEDQEVARRLAYTGAIKDEILDIEELAWGLLGELKEAYADALCERYKLNAPLPEDAWDLLQEIGKKRGMLISGGEINTERTSIMLLDEFRAAKIGRITLERVGS